MGGRSLETRLAKRETRSPLLPTPYSLLTIRSQLPEHVLGAGNLVFTTFFNVELFYHPVLDDH